MSLVFARAAAIRVDLREVLVVLWADSAYYGHDVIAAALRQGARVSITARQDEAVRKAISTIGAAGWTTIQYTDAVFDEQQQRWISAQRWRPGPFR